MYQAETDLLSLIVKRKVIFLGKNIQEYGTGYRKMRSILTWKDYTYRNLISTLTKR